MRSSKLTIIVSISLVALVVGLGVTTARADGTQVKWKRIVGLTHPGVFSSTATFVGDVPSGGFAWSVKDGEARVDLEDGEIEFEVKGLSLAGGPITSAPTPFTFVVIGTTRGVTKVIGTLVCMVGTGSTPFPEVSTPPVPLSAKGNANFSGSVVIPAGCTDPNEMAFLIRIAEVETGIPTALVGRWIAHGAVRALP